MELQIKLNQLIENIKRLKENVTTEEATKTSFVLPLLSALGYDVFNPTIVVPEFTADIGRKKNEKVDYAIMLDDKPVILIEVKHHTQKLDRHRTQLERYFTVTESKFAILTNGIEYNFYSDTQKQNIMDDAPLLQLNLLDLKDRDVKELSKFQPENFDIDNILSMAEKRKNINAIKEIFKREIEDPSDDFIRFFASQLTDKPLRQNILAQYKSYTIQAFSEVFKDILSQKINNLKENLKEEDEVQDDDGNQNEKNNSIVTTQEELEGFFIVKAILSEAIDPQRVAARDTKSYFSILIDDNKLKWIARLHFNSQSKKYIEIRTADKESEKIQISSTNDIYNYKQQLINITKNYI